MRFQLRHLAASLATLGLLMALAAPTASAGARLHARANLRAAIESYDTQLATVNTRVETALEEYSSTNSAAAVEAAIGEELMVLRAPRTTLKAEKVGAHPHLRHAKTEMTTGLRAAIVAYEHLSNTFADLSVSPKIAKKEFRHYELAIHRAIKDIRRGASVIR